MLCPAVQHCPWIGSCSKNVHTPYDIQHCEGSYLTFMHERERERERERECVYEIQRNCFIVFCRMKIYETLTTRRHTQCCWSVYVFPTSYGCLVTQPSPCLAAALGRLWKQQLWYVRVNDFILRSLDTWHVLDKKFTVLTWSIHVFRIHI